MDPKRVAVSVYGRNKERRNEGGRRRSLRQRYQTDADADVMVETRKELGGGGKSHGQGALRFETPTDRETTEEAAPLLFPSSLT